MFEISNIAEFSRCHCISICAFLVPANLSIASATMLLTAIASPGWLVNITAVLGLFPALLMLFHVVSWWAIGVVMLPTYILPLLALTCLSIYIYAVFNGDRMGQLLRQVWEWIFHKPLPTRS